MTDENGLFEDVWDLNGNTDKITDKKIIKGDFIKEWDDVLNVYEESRSQQPQKQIGTEKTITDTKSNKPEKPEKPKKTKSKLKHKIKQQFNEKQIKKVTQTKQVVQYQDDEDPYNYDEEYDDSYDAYYE